MSNLNGVKFNAAISIISGVLTDSGKALEVLISTLKPSRERSIAITKLEECIMWCNKALRQEQIKQGIEEIDPSINEKLKDYPLQPWDDSDDVSCFGVPCDEGITIMTPYDAVSFVSANDMMSMIALRIPKEQWDILQEIDDEEYRFEIKDSYYQDYKGNNLI